MPQDIYITICIDYRGIQSADTEDGVLAVMYSEDGKIKEVCRDKDIDEVLDNFDPFYSNIQEYLLDNLF